MPSSQKSLTSVIVAIDGPAGAGKSTVAKKLAQLLGFEYLDTGAMYRALTLKALREKLNLEDEDNLVELAHRTKIDLNGQEGSLKVWLDGQDVSKEIRTIEVTNQTHFIARTPRVRQIMVGWQQEISRKKNVVVEGRDTTTVVFPTATYKFYLDADASERCRRRSDELKEKGESFDTKKLFQEIQDRDHKDKTRTVGALKKQGMPFPLIPLQCPPIKSFRKC